jgi:hypothetical protein
MAATSASAPPTSNTAPVNVGPSALQLTALNHLLSANYDSSGTQSRPFAHTEILDFDGARGLHLLPWHSLRGLVSQARGFVFANVESVSVTITRPDGLGVQYTAAIVPEAIALFDRTDPAKPKILESKLPELWDHFPTKQFVPITAGNTMESKAVFKDLAWAQGLSPSIYSTLPPVLPSALLIGLDFTAKYTGNLTAFISGTVRVHAPAPAYSA